MLNRSYIKQKMEKLQSLYAEVVGKLPEDFSVKWNDNIMVKLHGVVYIPNNKFEKRDGIQYDMVETPPEYWAEFIGDNPVGKISWLSYFNELYRKLRKYKQK